MSSGNHKRGTIRRDQSGGEGAGRGSGRGGSGGSARGGSGRGAGSSRGKNKNSRRRGKSNGSGSGNGSNVNVSRGKSNSNSRVVAHSTKWDRKKDYLDEDAPLSGQKFMAISFISLDGDQREEIINNIAENNRIHKQLVHKIVDAYIKEDHPKRALKVRGSYPDLDDAKNRGDYLKEIDPDIYTYVAEVGKWIPFYPNPDDIDNQIYQEDALQELMMKYKENRVKSTVHYEQRKQEMMKKAIQEGMQDGQEMLSNKEEPFIAVENKVAVWTEEVNELEHKLANARETLQMAIAKKNKMIEMGLDKEPEKIVDKIDIEPLSNNDSEISNIEKELFGEDR